jgi:hypothetical protein
MSVQVIELFPPAVESKSLFATPEQYEKFRESFIAEVTPQLEKWEEAHRRSVHESFCRGPLKLAA